MFLAQKMTHADSIPVPLVERDPESIKGPRKNSLIVRMSVWYLSLTLINIILFWVGTGSNQMRLISDKATMYARSVSFETIRRLQPQMDFLAVARDPMRAFARVRNEFERELSKSKPGTDIALPDYSVFNTDGEVLLAKSSSGAKAEVSAEDLVAAAKILQLKELRGEPFMAVPYLSQSLILVYIPLSQTGDVDLVLSQSIEMPGLKSEIISLVRLGIAMVVLLLILQGGMALLIYRMLVRPIRSVSEAAQVVARGHFVRVDFKSRHGDEVSQLVASFNKMSQDLHHNREIMNFELGIARKIQESILPQTLEVGQVRATAHYAPLYTVSGDFYDFQELDDGSVAIFIADASGHGVPAAFLTIMAKIYFGDFVRKDPDPAVVLSRMNTALAAYFEGAGLYMTAFYLRLHADNSADYCNAMHPDPIILRKDGSTEVLESSAFYVGMMREVFKPFVTMKTQLQPGDRLVLYTDGLTEAKDANDSEFTAERFTRLVEAGRQLAPGDQVRTVLEAVSEFTGDAKLTDDATMIICEIFQTEKNGSLLRRDDRDEVARGGIKTRKEYLLRYEAAVKKLSLGIPAKVIWSASGKHLRAKDFLGALAGYQALATTQGESADLLLRISLCFYGLRQYDECVAVLRRCISVQHDTPDAHAIMSLLALRAGDYGKAYKHIETALLHAPSERRYAGILRRMATRVASQ